MPTMFSLRVSTQRTGRPVWRAAQRDRDHLPVHGDLGAEAAADVRRDHPDGGRLQPQFAGEGDSG